jgi:hypothetical protein
VVIPSATLPAMFPEIGSVWELYIGDPKLHEVVTVDKITEDPEPCILVSGISGKQWFSLLDFVTNAAPPQLKGH